MPIFIVGNDKYPFEGHDLDCLGVKREPGFGQP